MLVSTLKITLEDNDWDYKDAKPTDFVYMNIFIFTSLLIMVKRYM